MVVRDRFADRFSGLHRALFVARHDEGRDLRDPQVVGRRAGRERRTGRRGAGRTGEGWPSRSSAAPTTDAVADHEVFGVPTFIAGDHAVFVRLMTRPEGDAALARATIDRWCA